MKTIFAVLAGLFILAKLREQSGASVTISLGGGGAGIPYGGAAGEGSIGPPVYFGDPGSGGPGYGSPSSPTTPSGSQIGLIPHRVAFGGTVPGGSKPKIV